MTGAGTVDRGEHHAGRVCLGEKPMFRTCGGKAASELNLGPSGNIGGAATGE